MVFNASFNTISVNIVARSVILVEETGVLAENHHPAASHWQALSHNVVSSTSELDSNHNVRSRFELTTSVVIGTDYIGSCKSNYHTITTTTSHGFKTNSIYNVYWYWTSHETKMSRIRTTTLVVIGTDCIGSYKSNYHMIMNTTAPWSQW
jgi:hypothetical protein